MNLQPHQQRVVDEKVELDAKLALLQKFWNAPMFETLPVEEKQRLLKQGGLMMGYSAVLGERIAAF